MKPMSVVTRLMLLLNGAYNVIVQFFSVLSVYLLFSEVPFEQYYYALSDFFSEVSAKPVLSLDFFAKFTFVYGVIAPHVLLISGVLLLIACLFKVNAVFGLISGILGSVFRLLNIFSVFMMGNYMNIPVTFHQIGLSIILIIIDIFVSSLSVVYMKKGETFCISIPVIMFVRNKMRTFLNARKQKSVAERILEFLSPYGYFRSGCDVWKCSFEGKYVIRISSEMLNTGNLKDLHIGFTSFYAPLQKNDGNEKKDFILHPFDLSCTLRDIGYECPTDSASNESFNDTLDEIIKAFENIILPILPIHDDLNEYLSKTEEMLHLRANALCGHPGDIDIDEIAYAYLSLHKMDDAVRVINQYAEQCTHAADCIVNQPELFNDSMETLLHKKQSALDLIETLKQNGYDNPEIAVREKANTEIFHQYFR